MQQPSRWAALSGIKSILQNRIRASLISLANSITSSNQKLKDQFNNWSTIDPQWMMPSTNATSARASTKSRAEGLVLENALLGGTLPWRDIDTNKTNKILLAGEGTEPNRGFLRCHFLRTIICVENHTKLGRTSIERQIHHNAPTLPLSGTLGDKVVYAE